MTLLDLTDGDDVLPELEDDEGDEIAGLIEAGEIYLPALDLD